MTSPRITNYKISLKINLKNSPTYDELVKQWNNKLEFGMLGRNFFTYKKYHRSYIIYRGGHINLTGIRDLNIDKIKRDCLQIFSHELESFAFDNGKSYQIDNISAVDSLGEAVNLIHFALMARMEDIEILLHADRGRISVKKIGIYYEPELFHAIRIVTDCGTAIIFSTGKINFLGSKSRDALEWVQSRTILLYNIYKKYKPEIHLYDSLNDKINYINDISSKYLDPVNHLIQNNNENIYEGKIYLRCNHFRNFI
jgi:TATA-box binding protein (TBP) (component of TFIID and TFIIIB)